MHACCTKLNFSRHGSRRALIKTSALAWCFLAFVSATLPCLAENRQDGIFVSPQSAQLYSKISEYETTLYGHNYPTQRMGDRINRVEKTLFGARQPGAQESRFLKVMAHMDERKNAELNSEQVPMVEYLEQKLFMQTYPALPINERIRRLEAHVFGRTFDDYPVEIRIKKLTYTMPIVAKEVRLAKGGTVVATTARKTQNPTKTLEKKPTDMALIDVAAGGRVIGGSKRASADGLPISTGDYYQEIYRRSDGQALRWLSLPMKVHIANAASTSGENREITIAAISNWARSFPVQLVESSAKADVMVDWANSAGTTGPFTKPVLHLDGQRSVRTVILINMTPFRELSESDKLHGMMHQIGHAAGLWGHSDDPADIMYPRLKLEGHDISPELAGRSAKPVSLPPVPPTQAVWHTSQRDNNTLIRLYQQPGFDLRNYSPD